MRLSWVSGKYILTLGAIDVILDVNLVNFEIGRISSEAEEKFHIVVCIRRVCANAFSGF